MEYGIQLRGVQSFLKFHSDRKIESFLFLCVCVGVGRVLFRIIKLLFILFNYLFYVGD